MPSESPRNSVRGAIWNRLTDWLPYADALDEKEINEKTDRLLSDLEPLLAEVDRLNRWKAEATPVMLGLQDLGRALGLPLGENITGPAAVEAAERLRAQVAAVERASDRIAVWGYKVDPVRIAQEIESALRGDRS